MLVGWKRLSGWFDRHCSSSQRTPFTAHNSPPSKTSPHVHSPTFLFKAAVLLESGFPRCWLWLSATSCFCAWNRTNDGEWMVAADAAGPLPTAPPQALFGRLSAALICTQNQGPSGQPFPSFPFLEQGMLRLAECSCPEALPGRTGSQRLTEKTCLLRQRVLAFVPFLISLPYTPAAVSWDPFPAQHCSSKAFSARSRQAPRCCNRQAKDTTWEIMAQSLCPAVSPYAKCKQTTEAKRANTNNNKI